jgi:hypothetical protein
MRFTLHKLKHISTKGKKYEAQNYCKSLATETTIIKKKSLNLYKNKKLQ